MTEVVVPVLQRHGHQVNRFAAGGRSLHGLYSAVETAETDELLGRNPHIIAEHAKELTLSQTSDGSHLRGGHIAFRLVASRHHFADTAVIGILFVRQMTQEESVQQRSNFFRSGRILEYTVQLHQALIAVTVRREHFAGQLLEIDPQKCVHTHGLWSQ